MVLPRGLTWAYPLGSTVATRHTCVGNALSMSSRSAFGIVLTPDSFRSLELARRPHRRGPPLPAGHCTSNPATSAVPSPVSTQATTRLVEHGQLSSANG